jgi:hypothetical protein
MAFCTVFGDFTKGVKNQKASQYFDLIFQTRLENILKIIRAHTETILNTDFGCLNTKY